MTASCTDDGRHRRGYRLETVPFTGRVHLVPRSSRPIREATEAGFSDLKTILNKDFEILGWDHPDSVRVRRIASEIVGAVRRGLAITAPRQKPLFWVEELDWEVVVVRDKSVRARCFPGGGKIVVHTGLLRRFGSDAEIATFLGHEVGHVIARHSSEMIMRFVDSKRLPTILANNTFLRRQEIEADYIGMMLLAAAGFDPHVAPQTLEKLAQMIIGDSKPKGCRRSLLSNYLSLPVHPSAKKRSQLLSQPKAMNKAMELYVQEISDGARVVPKTIG